MDQKPRQDRLALRGRPVRINGRLAWAAAVIQRVQASAGQTDAGAIGSRAISLNIVP